MEVLFKVVTCICDQRQLMKRLDKLLKQQLFDMNNNLNMT